MQRVIELLDKKVETLFNRQDFEYLLERYMGMKRFNISAICLRKSRIPTTDRLMSLPYRTKTSVKS